VVAVLSRDGKAPIGLSIAAAVLNALVMVIGNDTGAQPAPPAKAAPPQQPEEAAAVPLPTSLPTSHTVEVAPVPLPTSQPVEWAPVEPAALQGEAPIAVTSTWGARAKTKGRPAGLLAPRSNKPFKAGLF
jgi:hypothetical protein